MNRKAVCIFDKLDEINSYIGVLGMKKKLLLRIDPKLHDHLRQWADDDFRSINAQIEFLLKKAVAQHRRDTDEP